MTIGVETTTTRAIRWASSVDRSRHIVLVGPSGVGKTFAAARASRLGMRAFELTPADQPVPAATARGIPSALKAGERLLLCARPQDLIAWSRRSDLDTVLAGILADSAAAMGAKTDWSSDPLRRADVFDLSLAVTADPSVIDDVTRKAATLALGCRYDAARIAAAAALRKKVVREWVVAVAMDAERRFGPLSIGEIWRFVASLATGAKPARRSSEFDLADTVACRLLSHEFMPDRLRRYALRQPIPSPERVASLAGYDGDAGDLRCVSRDCLAGQYAILSSSPPEAASEADDYGDLLKRLQTGERLMSADSLPGSLVKAIEAYSSAEREERGAEGAARGAGARPSVELSLMTPTPLMCRAFDSAWTACIDLRIDGRSIVLSRRQYQILAGSGEQGASPEPAPRSYGAEKPKAVFGVRDAPSATAGRAAPRAPVADESEVRSRGEPSAPDAALHSEARVEPNLSVAGVAPTDPQQTRTDAGGVAARAPRVDATGAGDAAGPYRFDRPTGLLRTLAAKGLLWASVEECGAFRVANAADLAASRPTALGDVAHVDRLGRLDKEQLGAALEAFVGVRRIVAGASAPDRVLDACLRIDARDASDLSTLAERYASAYAALLEAAKSVGGDLFERVLMLDVAYCPREGQRRARLLPLHPLLVAACATPADGRTNLPAVIAVRSYRLIAMSREGEDGFYHSDPERWPPVVEQRAALRAAVSTWLDRRGGSRLDLDLVDSRFNAALVFEAAAALRARPAAEGDAGATLRVRALASSLARAESIEPLLETTLPDVQVHCDPSVRPLSEARSDALVFKVDPAPHAGRAPIDAPSGSAVELYQAALKSVGVDPRPHRLESSGGVAERGVTALLGWVSDPTRREGGAWRLSLDASLRPDDAAPLPGPEARPTTLEAPGAEPPAQVVDVEAASPRSAPPVAEILERRSAPSPGSGPSAPAVKARRTGERRDAVDGIAGGGTRPGDESAPRTSQGPIDVRAATAPQVPPATATPPPVPPQAPAEQPPPQRAERPRWGRETLRSQIATALGRTDYATDDAMIADVVRDAVAARRAPLRHEVVRDVAACVTPAVAAADVREAVLSVVNTLVDLGDLVARRSSDRAPYLIETASAAFVPMRGSPRALLLGRAEVALSESSRAAVACSGAVRTVDLHRAREAREELRFRGAAEISWEDWARVPREGRDQADREPERVLEGAGPYALFNGDLDEYEAFEPKSSPSFYVARFRRGALSEVLERDRWAVAQRDGSFDGREYRVFRREGGSVLSAGIEYTRFVELAAACAARAKDGRRFRAVDGGGALRLHFPPTRWLARLLAIGQPTEPEGALAAWRLPVEVSREVRAALQRALWCEVVSG